ncbi:hypothetical protein HPP92_028156 [Vanilla planifolia]|uniref:Uncharacterized protein n=1 Tax=Vanilla planifolia TaxID=51239 RepID=A0A835U3S8_VANPL|nr:hypothetical protein HPP92_028156 [Vanilla planifolia]
MWERDLVEEEAEAKEGVKVPVVEVEKEESEPKWMADERAYASQARDIRRLITDSDADSIGEIHSHSEKEVVYTMVKGRKSSDDVILIETSRDRIIRSTCESLARNMIERIQSNFPMYDGLGMNSSIQVDATKFLDDLEGDVPKMYKYENDIVTDIATRDASSPLLYQVYGSPRSGTDLSLQGTYNQLLERQLDVWLKKEMLLD